MNNLKSLIERAGKYLTLPLGILTIDSYIRGLNIENLRNRYETELRRNRELENKVNDLLEEQINKEEMKTQLMDKVTRRSESLDLVQSEAENIRKISAQLNQSNISEEIRENLSDKLNNHVSNLSDNLSSANDKLKEIIDLITGSGSSSKFNNSLFNLIENFKISFDNILYTLTLEQKGALAHILMSMFILFCLITLISIYCGDYLINYFNLEEKYPKLAKFIKIRAKIQRFTFLLNSLGILIALLIIIIFNLYIFYNFI
jgi:hypothetical protein